MANSKLESVEMEMRELKRELTGLEEIERRLAEDAKKKKERETVGAETAEDTELTGSKEKTEEAFLLSKTKPKDKETQRRHPPVPLYLTAVFGAIGIIIAAFIGGPVTAYRYFAMIYILLSTFLWVPLLWMLYRERNVAAAYLLFFFSLLNMLVVLIPLGLSGS